MSQALAAFGSALALVFLAELGDKTQLALIAMARPGHRFQIWIAVSIGFLILSTLAVLAGGLINRWIAWWVVATLSGALFIFLGIRSLLDSSSSAQPNGFPAGGWTALGLVFLTEMGDKSQLATAALAAAGHSPLAIGVGAALALSANAALAVVAGAWLASRVSRRRMAQVTGVLFLVLGAVSLALALVSLASTR